MADLQVIKYHPEGNPQTGLERWPDYRAEILHSGNPVQHGHVYHSSDGGRFTSGVWDCTENELKMAPYDVDELMILLQGSITIEHRSGEIETFHAGQAFVIPKGCDCIWRQTEYVRKYWAIHEDPHARPQAGAKLRAMLADADAELPAMAAQDPALFESEIPQMGLLTLYQDPSGKIAAGVWDCSPMKRVSSTIERSELMHILEGNGSITNADGVVFEFQAGDTFMVPQGMGYQWQNHSYVKKIFCSYSA